ncbi:apoptosis regulator R1 [Trichonephila clavipes]|uniref:Apoptosis regulator R1 n=1 Tax=Trichonephila clavipes TaxID=2585209 RepID=A0A8X6RJB9_TRICX|nr:apoptosis regulator R1 [Trichonephila clavipes]
MAGNGLVNSDSQVTTNGDRNSIDLTTAFFVSDFIQYKLGASGYQWNSPLRTGGAGNNHSTTIVRNALRALADEFATQFQDRFVHICDQLEFRADTMKPTIEGVANELFCEGIKWSRIVAFFVFGSELAVHCKNRNWFDLINIIAYSLAAFISENLLPWINDHGGWDGLIQFNEGGAGADQNAEDPWPSMKNLLCIGISALGAITLGAVLPILKRN